MFSCHHEHWAFFCIQKKDKKKTLVSTLYQISYREKYLSLVWTPVITAMKSGTDTHQIWDDPLSKSARCSYRTAPKSQLSCTNKSPFSSGFHAGARANRYSKDIALIALRGCSQWSELQIYTLTAILTVQTLPEENVLLRQQNGKSRAGTVSPSCPFEKPIRTQHSLRLARLWS